MFVTTIQSRGLPWPDGSIRGAGEVFDFSFCLAEENRNRWLMGIESWREDRVTYLPVSALQGEWLDAQADLMTAAGIELSWWLRNPWAAFELVERLGACRIGATLQERLLAEDQDIIAPTSPEAESMLVAAHEALAGGRYALAFDLATRLLAGEGFRARARQVRERVLDRFGCFDDAVRERDKLALLGASRLPEHALSMASASPSLSPCYRAVAIELQGLPLDYPALDNYLVRYLYRLDIPAAGSDLPWLVRMPEQACDIGGETAPELQEQETWLHRTSARQLDGRWEVAGEATQDAFLAALQNGLATADRWELAGRIRRAGLPPGPSA